MGNKAFMDEKNNKYTLLYDGQCTICRYFIKNFLESRKGDSLELKPFQAAEFDQAYPPEQLKRCKAEIILVNEKEKTFLGGITAISKTLELVKLWPALQAWLNIPFLKPLNHFGYRIIAWHRYTWFIVPPYLRCAECELEIPFKWNFIFFALFSVILFTATYWNLSIWFTALADSAEQLFNTVKNPLFLLPVFTALLATFFSGIFQFVLFSKYKKVLGLPKLELFKQYLLLNTINAVLLAALLPMGELIVKVIANFAPNINSSSLNLLVLTSLFCISLPLTQLLIYKRLREINFENKFILITCLGLELIIKSLCPILILRLI